MLKQIDTVNVPDGHAIRVPMTMMDEKHTEYETMCDRLENAWKTPPAPVTHDDAYDELCARLEDAWRK